MTILEQNFERGKPRDRGGFHPVEEVVDFWMVICHIYHGHPGVASASRYAPGVYICLLDPIMMDWPCGLFGIDDIPAWCTFPGVVRRNYLPSHFQLCS
ncbi:MAG: hypothetical protein F4203_01570 [Rhodobacteraceae bacterium]|nr:hypothetical protein [Paracoccaceae bacterium]